MAFTLQAGALVNPAPGTFTVPMPADVVAGDLLILIINNSSPAGTLASSGYTNVWHDTTASDDFWVFTKTAGSSEPSATVTGMTGGALTAVVVRIRGWDPAGGPAQLTALASATTTASIDPPDTGALKFAIVHADNGSISVTSVTWGGGSTSIGTWTIGGGGGFISAAYKIEDTAGGIAFTRGGSATPGTLIFSVKPGAVSAPVADFTGTPTSGTASLSVTFTDTSTNGPTSWAWDFGDGGTSSSQNPTHSYTTSGVYTVTLIATNSAGSNTKTRTAYISVTETVVYAAGGGIDIF